MAFLSRAIAELKFKGYTVDLYALELSKAHSVSTQKLPELHHRVEILSVSPEKSVKPLRSRQDYLLTPETVECFACTDSTYK